MRILFFSLLVIIAFALPWWITLPCALLYIIRYPAIEVIFLAVLLDAYYGTAIVWAPLPILYTLTALVLVLVGTYVKPYLIFHE